MYHNTGELAGRPVGAELGGDSSERVGFEPSGADYRGVQGHLLMMQEGAFQDGAADKDAVRARIEDTSSLDWDQYSRISQAEIQSLRDDEVSKTDEEWIEKMTAFLDHHESEQVGEIMTALGIDIEGDDAVAQLLSKRTSIENFVTSAANVANFEQNKELIGKIAGSLFGPRVAREMTMQLTQLVGKMKEASGDEGKMDALADELIQGMSKIEAGGDEVAAEAAALNAIKAMNEKASETKRQAEAEATIEEAENRSDDPREQLESVAGIEGLPEKAGGYVQGMRANQDRIQYVLNPDGIEIFAVNDGAGDRGAEAAEVVTKKIAEYLQGIEPSAITLDLLKQVAEGVHLEMKSEGSSDPLFSTIDTLFVLPDGRKFILHVGEGMSAKFRMRADLADAENSQGGRLLETLTQPHHFEQNLYRENDGANRSRRGFKTKGMGVDADITPDVIEVGKDDVVMLASDGLGDVLPFLSIQTPRVRQLLREKKYKELAQYYGETAKAYAEQHAGLDRNGRTNADDISVLIV